MFLRRLILENVRSISQLEMPFVTDDGKTRKWTLLLGENGCGKSTVLRSIALLLAGSDALPELLKDPEIWIRNGRRECRLAADLVTSGGEERHIELRLRRGDKIRDVFTKNQETLDQLDKALDHSPRSYLTIGYGVSRRLSSDTATLTNAPSPFQHVRSQSVATLFAADATLNPLENWAMDLDYRRQAEGLRIVKNALADLLPGVTFQGIDKEKRQLMFKTPDGSVPLSSLSDAYQNVAAWCGDLLYRITEIFADYRNPFSARGLLLIDELDLHLHPVWKRQLMDFLNAKLPNFQIVATTHSALTVHQAGEGELFMLRRDNARSAPTLHAYPGAPRNLMLHQLLVSPLFGLTTVDSKPVEQMKQEYRSLTAKNKAELNESQKRRLPQLRQELETLPEWSQETPRDKKQRLLEEIHQALEASGVARHPASRSAARAARRSSTVKATGAKAAANKATTKTQSATATTGKAKSGGEAR